MKVAIMTDTNSGITKNIAESLGIFLIHMPIIIGDETFYENDTITNEEYFSALESDKKITTSQPSPGDVLDMWDSIFEKGYDQIVYIPMSSGLSNSYSASASYSAEYNGSVQVVDNHRISVTLRESVFMAHELAIQGMSAKEIKTYLEEDAYNSSIYIAVNTLDYLKKGGRITPAAAMIGTVLSIKPILTIQGEKLDSYKKIRGSMKKALPIMLTALSNDIESRFKQQDQTHLHIGLAGANLSQEEIDFYLDMVRQQFSSSDIYYNPLSASISCHTGPGALGIGISYR